MIYYFTTTRMSGIKKPDNMCHQECKEMVTFIPCWKKPNGPATLENGLAAPQMIRYRVTT